MKQYERQGKRTNAKYRNYYCGGIKIPFGFWPDGFIEKFTAEAAFYGLFLNFLCAKWAFFHNAA